MKINLDGLKAKGKMHFLIEEWWQGMPPTTDYQQQANALNRAMDAVEYIEQAFNDGVVVLAHKAADTRTIQIVAVDNLEQLNDYIKGNEAHARLPTENRRIIPLTDWNSGRETFAASVARAQVRARYEAAGQSQPARSQVVAEAQQLLAQKK